MKTRRDDFARSHLHQQVTSVCWCREIPPSVLPRALLKPNVKYKKLMASVGTGFIFSKEPEFARIYTKAKVRSSSPNLQLPTGSAGRLRLIDAHGKIYNAKQGIND